MKIKYEFVNGEISEIEVEECLGEVLVDMERQEYNNNHKETRRHTSLNAMAYEGDFFVSSEDVAGEVIQREEAVRLLEVIERLPPQQRELVHRVYFEDEKLSEIAREEGVDKSAIAHRLERIYKKLKNYLK